MKIMEITAVPSVRVDEFCEPQLIGDDIHAIGYQLRKDPDGGETYGVVEVRVNMNARKLLEVCRRVAAMALPGELLEETAPTIHH